MKLGIVEVGPVREVSARSKTADEGAGSRLRRSFVLGAGAMLCAVPRAFGQAARSVTVGVLIPFPETDAESQ